MYLSELINVERRYTRSINLERDINLPESVLGYIPTSKPIETLNRFIDSLNPNSIRRWTITGVYGTGKSAFVHFLSALCSSKDSLIRKNALNILKEQKGIDKKLIKSFERNISNQGFVRAIVTAAREPISYTVVKALYTGLNVYPGPIQSNLVNGLMSQVKKKEKINDNDVIDAIKEVSLLSPDGLLLIIDELGKNLEFATNNQIDSDLYLLQQISELSSDEQSPKVFVFAILHQAFSEYTYGISVAQKNEWMKIQGRFEDIPFIEAPEQIIKLIGSSIKINSNNRQIKKWAHEWFENLNYVSSIRKLDEEIVKSVYPLHPLTASVLPVLASKYAQNDRTIFTFLSSQEPYSFLNLIKEKEITKTALETIKLYELYDYFVESAGVLVSSRPNFQRWNEIQTRINDAINLDIDKLRLLKSIGILNLVSTGSSLRATKEIVINSMTDSYSPNEYKKWESLIDKLEKQRFITVRKKLNEIRIWEGSEFNIEEGIALQSEKIVESLDFLLNKHFALAPLIAQRHSYKSGTLRYFERFFCSNESELDSIDCLDEYSDGLIVYWCGEDKTLKIPPLTQSQKPLILIRARDVKNLRENVHELVSLIQLKQASSELQIDAIARKEILQRINIAQKLVEQTIDQTYSLEKNHCYVSGKAHELIYTFNSMLSDECDKIYNKTLFLWNELINKRELTTQGSKARRELIIAMLDHSDKERLNITGNGPEYCIYESLLKSTGIHTKYNKKWLLTKPNNNSNNLLAIWTVIEDYFLNAQDEPQNIIELYKKLDLPPYGLKRGVVPILLFTVLLANKDKFSLYESGNFIPKITNEIVELLLKKPERFAVKNTQPNRLQSKVIDELYVNLFKTKTAKVNAKSILDAARALVKLVSEIPDYSKNTKRISNKAIAIRQNITMISEPDKLIFEDLPKSLGYKDLTVSSTDEHRIELYCSDLISSLKEINSSYDNLLKDCKVDIINNFNVQSNNLREELYKRSSTIKQKTIEPCLKRLINAIEEQQKDDTQWLEALIMVIADKPADSWNDRDKDRFKIQVQDISRRYLNLESIYREINEVFGSNINAKKVNCVDADGNEVNKILWIDTKEKQEAESICKKFIKENKLKNNPKLREAILSELLESLLNDEVLQAELKGQ